MTDALVFGNALRSAGPPPMKVAIRRIGNSHGVIIPQATLAFAHIGDEAEMVVEKGAIVLRPSRPARAGWAAASKAAVDAGEGGAVWPAGPGSRER